jgi:hypothetical protein
MNPDEPKLVHTAGNPAAIAGFVLGIGAIFTGWILVLGWVIAILAVAFSAFGLGRARHHHRKHRGLAITGVVLGTVGLLFGLWVFVDFVHHEKQLDRFDERFTPLVGRRP